MNNEQSITFQKTKQFAVRIIHFAKYLEERHEQMFARQILKSGTSIGANTRESWNAQSKADFINKLSIALKEADETAYWLELLVESGIIDQATFLPLRNDLIEIIALLTASIRTAKNNLKAEE